MGITTLPAWPGGWGQGGQRGGHLGQAGADVGRRRAHIAAAVGVDRVGPGDEDAGRAQLPDVLAQSRSLRESLQHGRGVLCAERGGVRLRNSEEVPQSLPHADKGPGFVPGALRTGDQMRAAVGQAVGQAHYGRLAGTDRVGQHAGAVQQQADGMPDVPGDEVAVLAMACRPHGQHAWHHTLDHIPYIPAPAVPSWTAARAAATAPHASWPSTTTSGQPSTPTPYSMLPSTSGP